VCNLEEHLLFHTLILDSVFSEYVVFYGDFILKRQSSVSVSVIMCSVISLFTIHSAPLAYVTHVLLMHFLKFDVDRDRHSTNKIAAEAT